MSSSNEHYQDTFKALDKLMLTLNKIAWSRLRCSTMQGQNSTHRQSTVCRKPLWERLFLRDAVRSVPLCKF